MIEVKNLTKGYKDGKAVDNLSFTVPDGEITGFLGPNGAGKSTTMRMIAGLDYPTGGEALIDGIKYQDLENPLHRVGTLLDAKAVHPNRTAQDHLNVIAAAGGIDKRRVRECLDFVGLNNVANKKVGGFSLGMQQRLGIAGALLGNPDHLILDEPANGLDAEGIRWIRQFLQSLASEGKSILISSHQLGEVSQMSQNLVVIGKGKLISHSSTDEIVEGYSQSEIYLVTPHAKTFADELDKNRIPYEYKQDHDGKKAFHIKDHSLEKIGTLAHSVNVPIFELSRKTGTLEDAFMHMTHQSAQHTAGKRVN